MRLPIADGDLYIRNFEIRIEDGVAYVVSDDGDRQPLDIPALERDAKLAKVHGCDPGTCRELSHTWRARDAELLSRRNL